MGEKLLMIHSLSYMVLLKIGCPKNPFEAIRHFSDTPIYAISSIQNSSPWHYINGVWLWIKNLETMVMPIAGTCRSTFPNKIRENYW